RARQASAGRLHLDGQGPLCEGAAPCRTAARGRGRASSGRRAETLGDAICSSGLLATEVAPGWPAGREARLRLPPARTGTRFQSPATERKDTTDESDPESV